MKSTVINTNVPTPEYPSLRESIAKGTVVLFTEESVGTVVSEANGTHELGHHSRVWDTSCFKPFTNTVTLSN